MRREEETEASEDIAGANMLVRDEENDADILVDQVRRVDMIPSPYLLAYYRDHAIKVTLDTGATTNMINTSFAKRMGLPISKVTQRARQADGFTALCVVGEVHCTLSRNNDHGIMITETCLEELMCRILGELIQEAVVVMIADDRVVAVTFSRTPTTIGAVSLMRLSAQNTTIIMPTKSTILGWIWSNGTLHATSHRPLALQSAEPPTTVHGLRSFIGAYKVLSHVLRGYALLPQPLECGVANRESRDKITWSDELLFSFSKAKDALKQAHIIHVPRPDDKLTDALLKHQG